jgi:hypothetical protein
VTVHVSVPRAEPGQQPADQPIDDLHLAERADVPWDAGRYWVAAHTSGLTSAQIRILDCLIGWARSTDVAALSLTKIGIGAALSKAAPDVRRLISAGWLKILPKLPEDDGSNGSQRAIN